MVIINHLCSGRMCNQLDRPNVCGSVARRVYAEGLFPFFCLFPRRVKWVAVGSVSARFIHIAGAVWLNYNNNTCSSLAWPYLLSMRASVVVSAHNSRPCLVSWAAPSHASLSLSILFLFRILQFIRISSAISVCMPQTNYHWRARARVYGVHSSSSTMHIAENDETQQKKNHTQPTTILLWMHWC